MGRLTDRKTAADLKHNCDGLRAKGIEPNISDLRYIKLAEYENRYERTNRNVEHKSFLANTIYELSEEPQEETKWLKDNPSLKSFITQRFTERR